MMALPGGVVKLSGPAFPAYLWKLLFIYFFKMRITRKQVLSSVNMTAFRVKGNTEKINKVHDNFFFILKDINVMLAWGNQV